MTRQDAAERIPGDAQVVLNKVLAQSGDLVAPDFALGAVRVKPGVPYLITGAVPVIYWRKDPNSNKAAIFTIHVSISVNGKESGTGVVTSYYFTSTSVAHHVLPPQQQEVLVGLRVKVNRLSDGSGLRDEYDLGDTTPAGGGPMFTYQKQSYPWLFVQSL